MLNVAFELKCIGSEAKEEMCENTEKLIRKMRTFKNTLRD